MMLPPALPFATARNIVSVSTSSTSVIPVRILAQDALTLLPSPTSSVPFTATLSQLHQPPMMANIVVISMLSLSAAMVSWYPEYQVLYTDLPKGYTKNGAGTCGRSAPGVSDFNPPANLPAAINAPTVKMNGQDFDSYNGMRLFNNNPYDPALCAAACESQTQFDKEHLVDSNGEYRPCNFFTSYILTKNGVPLGTYCALYTQAWSSDYAVNTGYSSDGDVYSVTCAAGYTATTQDGGKINVD